MHREEEATDKNTFCNLTSSCGNPPPMWSICNEKLALVARLLKLTGTEVIGQAFFFISHFDSSQCQRTPIRLERT